MGFGDAIRSCFSKFVTFSGRARRSEYWFFVLFGILVAIPAAIVDAVLFPDIHGNGPVQGVTSLVLFLPSLSVTVRRLHDRDWSGFWLLGIYIYAFAAICALVMLFVSGIKDPIEHSLPLIALLALGGVGYGIFLFVLSVLPGTQGPNKYGPDPKDPAAAAG